MLVAWVIANDDERRRILDTQADWDGKKFRSPLIKDLLVDLGVMLQLGNVIKYRNEEEWSGLNSSRRQTVKKQIMRMKAVKWQDKLEIVDKEFYIENNVVNMCIAWMESNDDRVAIEWFNSITMKGHNVEQYEVTHNR